MFAGGQNPNPLVLKTVLRDTTGHPLRKSVLWGRSCDRLGGIQFNFKTILSDFSTFNNQFLFLFFLFFHACSNDQVESEILLPELKCGEWLLLYNFGGY